MSWFSRAILASIVLVLPLQVALGQQQSTPAAIRQYRAAVALQNQQLFDLAVNEWQAFLKDYKADPLAAEAAHYLGVCHFQQQRYAQAIEAFQRALANKAPAELSPATRLNLGLAEYNLGLADNRSSFRQAAATFAELIERHPRSSEARTATLYLAECLVELDQEDAAIEVYERALSQGRGGNQREKLLYGLAVALQEQVSTDQAQRRLEQLIREFPNGSLAREATARIGDILMAQGKIAQALEVFASLSTNNQDELADYVLARHAACLFELKKYIPAADAYAKVVEQFPKSEHYRASMLGAGKSYYSAGQLRKAREWLSRAADADGDEQLDATHWLVQTELKSGDPKAALAVLTAAASQAAHDQLAPQLKLDLADVLYELPDRRGEAAKLYTSIAADGDQDDAPYSLYMSAFAQLELEDYARAIEQTKQFLRRFRTHDLAPDVLAILAECEYQQRNYAAAGKQWQQLCDSYADRPECDAWVVRRALCFERTDAPRKVIQWLRPRISQLTDEPLTEGVCLVSNAYLTLGQPQDAVRVLTPLIKAGGGSHADQALLLLARAEQAAGNADQAQASYARLVRDFPDSPLNLDARLQLAELAYADGKFEAASKKYGDIVQHANSDELKAAAMLGLGWSQLNHGKVNPALATLKQLVATFPKRKEAHQAHYAMAVAWQHEDKFSEAIEQLERFLSTQATPAEHADALFVRGVCQAALEEYDLAIDSFRQVVEADPAYADRDKVLYELAWAYESAGKSKQATRVFQRLAQQHRGSGLAAEAHYRVAEAAYVDEDYETAQKKYRVALASAAKQPEIAARAKHKIAWTLYQQEKYAEAAAAFRKQLSQSGNDPLAAVAQWMVGECAYRQGDYAAALRALGQAAETNGGDEALRAMGLMHAGQSAAQLGDWQQSLDFHSRCLADYPHSENQHQARYGQAWALQNLKQPNEAKRLYAQVADATTAVVGARARFMLGELQFADQDYDAAIRSFFKVAYGYGHPNSPADYHIWQADSLFEAARCCESTKRLDAAARLYNEVVQQYPASNKAAPAKRKRATLHP